MIRSKISKTSMAAIFYLNILLVNVFSEEIETASGAITEGDSEYLAQNNEAALHFYEKALTLEPDNYEACWKLARAYLDVGGKFTQKEARLNHYQKADELSRKAIDLNPEGEKGHLYLCVELGQLAADAGLKERVRISKEIKTEVDKALELDPADPVAWHILGRWNLELANLNWIELKVSDLLLGSAPRDASLEKAIECFQKAIELNPDTILNHLELGRAYEDSNQKDLAIAEYQKVIELPIEDVSDKGRKNEAEEHLKKLSPNK